MNPPGDLDTPLPDSVGLEIAHLTAHLLVPVIAQNPTLAIALSIQLGQLLRRTYNLGKKAGEASARLTSMN